MVHQYAMTGTTPITTEENSGNSVRLFYVCMNMSDYKHKTNKKKVLLNSAHTHYHENPNVIIKPKNTDITHLSNKKYEK